LWPKAEMALGNLGNSLLKYCGRSFVSIVLSTNYARLHGKMLAAQGFLAWCEILALLGKLVATNADRRGGCLIIARC
jgi:hypothetical protein